MTANDYDKVFGTTTKAAISHLERLGRADPPVNGAAAKAETVGSGHYKPYGFLPTSSIGLTCDVQRWVEGTEIPEGLEFPYRLMLQVAYTGQHHLRIYLPDCIIVVEGKQLTDLRKKLNRNQVTFIQQYNARVWNALPEKGETLIERISVFTGSAYAESTQTG